MRERAPTRDDSSTPPAGTIERWCADFVAATSLAEKLGPPPLGCATWESDPPSRRIAAPGRPPNLHVVERSPSAPRLAALADPLARARLFHTFVHHELQAAELFAWAVLAFADAPRAFRAGLLRLAREELAHLALYRDHMRALGVEYGDLPVRDWFWQRVASVESPLAFVALLGLGLEASNLEHTARYAARFREVGDVAGAASMERVERDEVRHVAFAREWFERFSGRALDFESWSNALPPPLTPALFASTPLNTRARSAAGLDAEFLRALESCPDRGARAKSPRSAT